jgi:hypothetical protein
MSDVFDRIFQPPTKGQTLPSPLDDFFTNLVRDPTLVDAAADIVWPPLSPDPNSPDSLIAQVGKPDGFDTPPDQLQPGVFESWHSAFQAEYINANKNPPNFDATTGVLTIGPVGGQQIHVTLSSAQDKVYILENLQIADFAAMTLADQQRIAQTDTFKNVLAAQFGLSGSNIPADKDAVVGPNSTYQQAINDVNNFDLTNIDPKIFSQADKQVFIDELNNIKTRVDQQGVFVATEINSAAKDIMDRFDRVKAFAQAAGTPQDQSSSFNRTDTNPDGSLVHPETQFTNVISNDGGAGVLSSLQNMMTAEKQILAADNASLQLATTGLLPGLTKHLDVPTLLAAFQMYSSLKTQGQAAADTEEIQAINELLQTYNVMQDLVARTLATFDVTKSDQVRGLLGYQHNNSINNNSGNLNDPRHQDLDHLLFGGDENGPDGKPFTAPPLTLEQVKVISMFEQDLGGIQNPIESLFNVTRPTFDFYDNKGATLNYFQKSFWDQAASRLSQAAQQLTQQNQIIFNNINSETKEQTTFYQNASDALSKLASLTDTMGRNI